MHPSARSPALTLPCLLVACLYLFCAAPALNPQTIPKAAVASAAQPLDATSLRGPVEIGADGLAQAGDDPAYALPDFDDSKWLPVDAKTALSAYFPHSHSDIIWQRLHIKVAPGQAGFTLQAYGIARAFEVYVNGQKLMQSGKVDPFVPYTAQGFVILKIPEARLRTGSLVIAIRARASNPWRMGSEPGFGSWMLTLGQERALCDQASLWQIQWWGATVLTSLLGLGVSLVGLALFAAQRRQAEYLWIFMLGGIYAVELPLNVLVTTRNLPQYWWIVASLLNFAQWGFVLVLVFQAFLRKPFGWLLWLYLIVTQIINFSAVVANNLGSSSASSVQFAEIPGDIFYDLFLPVVFFRQLRRGNREAGILLIPLLGWCLNDYARGAVWLLQQIPPLRAAGLHAEDLMNSFQIWIVDVHLYDVGFVSFWLSLVIIMVLRSTRMSRQQAVLEGEMAAARQVQQIILPEQVESVPGFTVETVYQPARQVGGDFFQVLPTGDGGLLVVVGDVADKGLPAAMLVSVLVGAIRGVAEYTNDPAELLANLNERLVGRGGFSTALVARITADGWVTIANAGHLSPYLDGSEVELPGALPLGAVYKTSQFQLAPGRRLTFYSDGVVEAQNQQGELFGFDRAKDLSTQPAAAIAEAAKQFGQSDDITVVTIARQEAIASAA